jgi:hypothetical protein
MFVRFKMRSIFEVINIVRNDRTFTHPPQYQKIYRAED